MIFILALPSNVKMDGINFNTQPVAQVEFQVQVILSEYLVKLLTRLQSKNLHQQEKKSTLDIQIEVFSKSSILPEKAVDFIIQLME